jgi:hypothetical protein
MMLWMWGIAAIGFFCVLRGILDVRERRYVWGAFGIVAGLVLLLTPISTQAVKFDLPPPAAR